MYTCVRAWRFALGRADGVHVHRCVKTTDSRKTQNPSLPSLPMAAMESAASAALLTGGASRKRPRSQSPPPAGEGTAEPAPARPRFGENLDLILSLQGKELSLERSPRLLPLLAVARSFLALMWLSE